MPSIKFIADGDGCWPELMVKGTQGRVIHSTEPFQVAYLPHGMGSGAPSLMLRFELPDGKTLLVETSVATFEMLAGAIRGRIERGDD